MNYVPFGHVLTFMENQKISPRFRRGKSEAGEDPILMFDAFVLLVWAAAGVVAFLPFAFNTSAWDAVTLRVPGNQGNWWHVLVGMPFFLAFPAIWLRSRLLFTEGPSRAERRIIWAFVGFSICGTISVEAPFVLHLAGTRGWPSFSLLLAGFGILASSGAFLFLRRHDLPPTRACIAGLNTAYLANAALCLIVYSSATGTAYSRVGWLMTMLLIWPMVFDLAWILTRTQKSEVFNGQGSLAKL